MLIPPESRPREHFPAPGAEIAGTFGVIKPFITMAPLCAPSTPSQDEPVVPIFNTPTSVRLTRGDSE